MIALIPWFDRTWVFTLPVGAFPAVLERLRGTPVRAEELITGVPDAMLRIRPNQTWSVKEHLGHSRRPARPRRAPTGGLPRARAGAVSR